MAFIEDAFLCERLRCLPSALDAEDGDRINDLAVYFEAKARAMKRKNAHAEQRARLQQGGMGGR